ncbi:nucleotide exchange factor GrpE [Limibaculum sp. FT325]|uniref:nucleotide exchange factor GrpE n=1 Tax=Thermohalobaculum sediminis TaxID=2939436 RepID=UPI0020C03C17|nr:nucleotide exchange factor GrpE [Limibaculum sediminis]MCL5776710.1 nucleotide exchange factor GrpE [Limibaculum sediminis]
MAKTQAKTDEPQTTGTTPEEALPEMGAVPGPDVRIAELEAERDELKDRLLRALAEAENTRRRAERDRKDAETYGGTRLARDILAVYDNLTRALAAADDSIKTEHAALFEGIELTRRELLNAFEKHKIRETTPQKGEKFDPNLHQAMFEAPIPGAQPGTIIEVMQAGFVIADRLLRPALVGVARAMPQAAGPAAEAAPENGEDKAG